MTKWQSLRKGTNQQRGPSLRKLKKRVKTWKKPKFRRPSKTEKRSKTKTKPQLRKGFYVKDTRSVQK